MDKALRLLGLATRAGKVVSGGFLTEKLVKSGQARLVIVAEDASENTKKLFRDKCRFYEAPLKLYSSINQLGRAIGKGPRSSVGISDKNFAVNIKKLIDEEEV